MKHDYPCACRHTGIVAPFTGAWIETMDHVLVMYAKEVAPFTGAWIETNLPFWHCCMMCVAPFTGAWIETIIGVLIF